jgi:hypothetical protein
MVFDKAGNLYGTASYGGSGTVCSPSCGVVYELKRSTNGWSETVLYNFLGGTDGPYPVSGVRIAEGAYTAQPRSEEADGAAFTA